MDFMSLYIKVICIYFIESGSKNDPCWFFFLLILKNFTGIFIVIFLLLYGPVLYLLGFLDLFIQFFYFQERSPFEILDSGSL